MSEPFRVKLGRVTAITVRLGEAQPTGSTFAAQIRATDDPTSELLGTWSIDDTDAETTGVLVLTIEPDDITDPLSSKRGRCDIVRVIAGSPFTVFGPHPVVFVDGPTVPA
jgi:hypothetical protein